MLRYLLFLLCATATVTAADDDDQVSDPDELTVKPLESYHCGDTSDSKLLVTTTFYDNSDGDKVADMKLEVKEEITEYWTVVVKIEKWNQDSYQVVYEGEGPLCQMMQQYASKAWKKITSNFSPPMMDSCNITPDNYEAVGLEVLNSDYDFPVAERGKFKTTVRFLNEMDDEMMCFVMDVENVKKS